MLDKVRQLAAENGATLLLVALCGSRAFGYAAPQSDADVRFVYVYPQSRYFSLAAPPKELRLKDDDVVGYELGKFLAMAVHQGWGVLELLHSPLWYEYSPALTQELRRLCTAAFSPASAVPSLLSCAKTYSRRLEHLAPEEEQSVDLRVKLQLGALRMVAAAYYLTAHQSFYPISLHALVQSVLPSVAEDVALLAAWRAGSRPVEPAAVEAALVAVRAVAASATASLSELPGAASGEDCTEQMEALYMRVVLGLPGSSVSRNGESA